MHEFERESHLLCSLLVREWAGQGQWEPNNGPSLWNWWCGRWFLSRQLWHLPRWHQGLPTECASVSWVEKALGNWVCLHWLFWAHLHLCSCSLDVTLCCLMRRISWAAFWQQRVAISHYRQGLLLTPTFPVQQWACCGHIQYISTLCNASTLKRNFNINNPGKAVFTVLSLKPPQAH